MTDNLRAFESRVITPPARWARLADDLAAAGIELAEGVPASPNVSFSQGVTRTFMGYSFADGSAIGIHDKWWNKNLDVWIGWQVHVEDADSITRRTWPITKNRADVVADVLAARELVAVAS